MAYIKRHTFDELHTLTHAQQQFVVGLFWLTMRADGPINGVERTMGEKWAGLIGISRLVYEGKMEALDKLAEARFKEAEIK